ncbi:MAG: PAS domain S-box protein, partial [Gammaproteobacteria bacterium]|nr:PAS domain S-box protein [Gammaproteobacteria bacterium]
PDLVWLKDPDGVYLACNPAFENLYGAPESEIAGKTDYDFVERTLADFFREKDREAIVVGAAKVNEEWLSFARGGYRGLFETIKTPMYDADGALIGVLGVARDITEIKRTQAELEQEVIRRRILFEQSTDGIVVLDEQGGVFESNSRFAAMIGYSPEETRLLHVWDWDAQWTREELLQRLAADPAVIFETQHRRKDGSLYDVEVSTNRAEWNGRRLRYCVCRDISARKAAESALLESEERFRATFEQAGDGIALIDAETLRFTQFNDAAHQQLGYTREEFAALDLSAIQAQFDRDQIGEKVATILATGKADFESRHRRKDGGIRDVRVTNRVINLRGRRYFAALWSDITERKRAEKALRETAMFLKESQAIARVGGWKANPVTGLLIWTEEVYRLVGHPLERPPETLEEGLEYYAPEYRALIRGLLMTAWESGTPFITECEMIAGTGWRFWAELRCVGRVDQDGQAFITGTFQDVTERRRLEDEIRRREKYLRAVIDNFPFLVWLKDAEGRFLAVNAPLAQACGQPSPDAVLGKTDRDVWPADLAEQYWADDQTVLASGQSKSTEELIEERGSRSWIETYKSPIVLDGQVLGTVGFARDITLRRETESRLRDSEQALREAQAVAHIGSWTLDIRLDELRWSDETYRLFDIPMGTPLCLGSFLACVHPDDSEAVRKAWEHALTGAPYDVEHRVFTRGGERWIRERAELRFDDAGTPVFALGTAQDVTERHTADEQLRKLWLAVEQSPNSIVITDAEGRIEYVNQAFIDTTGYAREETLGENPRLLKSGHTPETTFADLWSALTRGDTWEGEFINRRRDGSLYTEHARLSPVRQPGGRVTHYLAVKEDITERKLAAAELDRYRHHLEELVTARTAELAAAKEVAEAASRAKSTFLANMSHEIRTPLNAIVGLTYLLQRKVPDPDAQRQLGKVAEAANHLLTLINDILDISKIEAGKLTLNDSEFDLASVLERVSALFWDKAVEKGLELVYDIDPELTGNLFGDPVRLGQVVMNLVGNAVKFTERGQILIRISPQAERADTLWLRCEVRDTGIGIRPEDQARLFAAFEQADGSTTRRYGGTGLGLAISQRLVHLMGGEIGVSSLPGQGSLFWFTTRLGKRDAGGPTVRNTLRDRVQGQHALVAEAQPGAREVLARLLRDLGLSVETASSGAEALRLMAAARRDRPFTVALMDPQLSGLNRTETASDATWEPLWRIPNLIWFERAKMPIHPFPLEHSLSVSRPITPAALYAILEQATEPTATNAAVHTQGSRSPSLPRADYASSRLLVVEDNAVNREVVLALLEEIGIRADLATNGAEAVAMARDRRYDLILMDVQMPVLDGLAATRAIRGLTDGAAVPIVAMTANAFDEDRARCLGAGMNGMLVKPIEPSALFDVVAERLTVREGLALPPRPGTPAAERLPGSAAEALGHLECIDTQRGLTYTGGDAARYLRALRMFGEGHGADPVRLQEMFEDGRWQDAEHLTHALKGVAALLGATQLQGRAADLEVVLRARAERAVLEETLAALEAAHRAVLSVLPPALSFPATEKLPVASGAAIRRELLELEALLAEDNAAATAVFQSAAPRLRSRFGDRADQLARLLDGFDYPPALALVHEFLAALPVDAPHED